MATIAYRLVGDGLVLFLIGDANPTENEWQDYSRFIAGVVTKLRVTQGTLRFLTFADEGGPNAKQRAAIVQALRELRTQTAVISNSMIVRHVITAFGWLNFPVKGFSPTQLKAAAEYLDLSRDRLVEAISTAQTMAPSLGGVRCLELAASALAREV